MSLKANFGIDITSYEVSKGVATPVLSHIFWGKTLKEAFGYAKSHLISDYFYSSTFYGETKWRDNIIYLEYDSKLLTVEYLSNKEKLTKDIMNDLRMEVNKVIQLQRKYQIPQIVNEMSLQQ